MKSAINIGFLGMGTVGTGAYRTLADNRPAIEARVGATLNVKKIAVAHPDLPRAVAIDRGVLTGDPYEVINDPDIDIVVELIGGVEPVKTYIRQAFAKGKHVVSANKELLAKHGVEVLTEASERHLDFYFEGAVAGGIPIIRPLISSLSGNRIDRIEGIVNGTTNYILTRMALEKREFAKVLADAQKLGYAEADPTSDVDGWDAAYKMCILAAIAMQADVDVEAVHPEGISRITERDFDYAGELGYSIKLLALAKRSNDRLEIRVSPTLLPESHPLAHVDDVFNAILVNGSSVGNVMFYGRGAGSMPTGSSVVGDIVEVARNICAGSSASAPKLCFAPTAVVPVAETVSRYYLRLQVGDRPRCLSNIAGALGDHDVSIGRVSQHEMADGLAELVLITHPCPDADLRRSLWAIEAADPDNAVKSVIRVEG
ncbi:MAG TPA: homoserine dehydrogenase [Armatimonadota bacterium]|jgi:homoserine dehydrogenase